MDELRYLYCKHYPGCLHLHARLDKQWFSCAGCRQYKPLYLDPEDIIEEALNVGEFLHALFFGLPEEEEMLKKLQEPSEFVSVPVDLLRGLIHSLYKGMESFQSSYNLAAKLNEVLKHREKHGQFTGNPEGGTGGTDLGAENL